MIFVLLVILSVMLYNEIINEKKLIKYFDEIVETQNTLKALDSTKFQLVKSQDALLKYLVDNNKKYVEEYFTEVKKAHLKLDSIQFQEDSIKEATGIKVHKKESYKARLDSVADSILPNLEKFPKKTKSYKKLNFKNLGVKATIVRKVTEDTIEKNGLFKRLGKALRNEKQIKEKKVEERIILEYSNNRTIGTLEKQLKTILNIINHYYKKEFSKIKRSYTKAEKKKAELLKVNNKIQEESKKLLLEYKTQLMKQEKVLTKKYNIQHLINRKIRLYVLLALSIVLIVLTLITIFLARSIYRYENHLIKMKSSLEENLAVKNRMVSMISHDIRSPLKIISIYVKQLLSLESDTVKRKIYSSIDFTTSSSLILANKILSFLKGVEQPKGNKVEDIDLSETINKLLEPFSILAGSNGNKFVNTNKVAKDFQAKLDIQELQRLYFNLIDNSIKFTKNGVIEVISNVEEYETGKYRFYLTVKDSGKGIEVDRLENIFDLISKKDTKDKDISAGLGLHLCREIVEMHGGKIKIKSKPNKGTEVCLFLNI